MDYITLPSGLVGFRNYKTETKETLSGRKMYLLHGELKQDEENSFCSHCATASRDLKQLLKDGRIESSGVTRMTRYKQII
jgi:hypothetical protein